MTRIELIERSAQQIVPARSPRQRLADALAQARSPAPTHDGRAPPSGRDTRHTPAALRARAAAFPCAAADDESPRRAVRRCGRCAPKNSSLLPDHELRGRRRRRRAQVGHEVRDREIGFVADAGNDRHRRCGDRAGQHFFVERPQIFERAAAARDDHDVDAFDARRSCGSRARLRARRLRPARAWATARGARWDTGAAARARCRAAPRRRST